MGYQSSPELTWENSNDHPKLAVAVATIAILAKSGGQASLTRSGGEIGVLKCNVKGCVSFVFGSARDINADGYGVGANALIDDFDKSVGLQPLSVEGIRGLNLTAGIAQLKLHSNRQPSRTV